MAIRGIDLRIASGTFLAIMAFATCAMAAADPPSRVARLANIDGPVTFSPGGEDEWALATPNRPLITGDRVWADANARAELQIGALAVRLGSQTSVTILNLDDRVAQFQLQQGTLNVRVRRMTQDQTVEVDTPLLAFSLRRAGVYRIDVDAASSATAIAVVNGEGEAYGDGAAYTISEGQWYRFADSELRDYQYDALQPADAFDAWTRDRDRREDNPVAARYVSPDVIGYSDLDEYGTWSTVEGYGNVWVPTAVARDWAPYHEGRWAWIEPWGWTWVDDAPWGFAPFHYGRWAYARERWCWVPGPVHARAVYAPALVAFVGGNNLRVSIGAGAPARGIAWFPLAPGEVYRPSYGVSRNYFTSINVSNTNITQNVITNVYNRPDPPNAVYRNRDQRGGVTAMTAAAFVQSRPVAQSAVPISREVATAGPVTPVASIAPVRASVMGGPGSAAVGASGAVQPVAARPPTAILRRPVIARVAPPAPPTPFNAREAGLARDPGRPPDPATLVPSRAASPAPTAPVVKVVAPVARGAPPPPAPTVQHARTNGPPPATGAPPAAPGSGVSGPPPQRPAAGTTTPQPPPAPALQPKPPTRPEIGGPAPKAEPAPQSPPATRPIAPPPQPSVQPLQPPMQSTQPSMRPAPQPPVQPAPQPPKPLEPRPAPQPPVQPAPQPPRPLEPRPMPAQPTSGAPAPELRRDPPVAPAIVRPPAAAQPAPAELRREPAPPPVVRPPVAVPAPAPAQPLVRPPAAPVQPAAGQPEGRSPAAKSEPARSKPDEKRDEKRDEPK